MATLLPRQPVPALDVATLGGERWRLAEQRPEHFTLIVFYRGLHCPICGLYMRELDRNIGEFAQRGVSVIAISSDTEERAREAQQQWKLQNVTVGYGLDLDKAREWGLFISTSRGMTSVGVEEPERFSEPGVFLIRPDGTLYFSAIQTMPFARPRFDEMLKAIDFVVEKNYPARGEVAA